MMSNSEASFYVDTLLVETVLSDGKFHKTAGFISDVLSKVKDYFGAHIRSDHAVEDVLRILAPGALWLFMQSIGLGKWGFLLGLLVDVFHIDIPGMIKSLYEKVKEMISGGQKVSSAQIDSATQEVAQQYSIPGNAEEAQQGYRNLQKKQQESGKADDHKVYSSLELLSDARMLRLALIEYEHQQMRLTKNAIGLTDFVGGYSRTKSKGSSLLSKILGWVIKIALFSGGLMIAGDAVNALLGRPSAMTGSYQAGKDDYNPLGPSGSSAPAAPSGPVSTQTKFPAKADSPLPTSWPLVNNAGNIENMLIQFTKDVYSGLDGKENIIRSSPAFQAAKENIRWFNIHNEGSSVIFLPDIFKSKKDLVDHYIDDVAKSA
jgi:hypothetical protein